MPVLDDNTDVTFAGSPVNGQLVRHNGIVWTNEALQPTDIPEAGVVLHNDALSHSDLSPVTLNNDDHLQYAHTDGRRGFSDVVDGIFPIDPGNLATKEYVDLIFNGQVIEAVEALSEDNIAPSGIKKIDNEVLVADERVLLIAQTDPIQNGPWLMKAGAWVRPADFANGSSAAGTVVYVKRGKGYGTTRFACVSKAPNDVVGTNNLVWTQHDGASSLFPGNGLKRTGNKFDIIVGNGLAVSRNFIFVQDEEIDHGSLNPLSLDDDDHLQYAHLDARRGFSNPVSGQAPLLPSHLVTKFYVDFVAGGGVGQLTEDIVNALLSAVAPNTANPFFTTNQFLAVLNANRQAALLNADAPTGINPYMTQSAVQSMISVFASGTRETLNCLASVNIGDFVYISSSSSTAAKAGSDTGFEAEGVVLSKPTSTTCIVEFGTVHLDGLTSLGFSAGDTIYLGASTTSPNVVNGSITDPVLGQRLGKMLNSDSARIRIDVTAFGAI